MKCLFCRQEHTALAAGTFGPEEYNCPRCGHVRLDRDCLADFPSEKFDHKARMIIGIVLRNEYERRGKKPPPEPLTLGDLHQRLNQYRELDPIVKMDNALLNLERLTKSKYVGYVMKVPLENEFPYYHCTEPQELNMILSFLLREGFIDARKHDAPAHDLWISPTGYERLRDIKKAKDSRQCFVAMWFAEEMKDIYEKAIKPGIEYIEEGEDESRFKALKIEDKEHTNDINDEIIAEIRRSKFMVCDLTGYRGGVYWEAGFAYGLGLEVIYTCREDWLETQKSTLVDNDGKEHEKIQEGIHFDLEHRPRIDWKDDTSEDFDEFKKKLTNKIRAVIF